MNMKRLDLLGTKAGDRWSKVLTTTKPGLYNSYGFYAHTLEEGVYEPEVWAGIRAELDIKDSAEASIAHDLRLTASFLGLHYWES